MVGSAFAHAGWNYLAKRAQGTSVFLWLATVISVALYAPLAAAVLVLQRPPLGPLAYGFMAGSAALHLVYFVLLLRGYAAGDLSLVYPLARGTGPLLATLGGLVFFAERPSGAAVAGIVLIAGGGVVAGSERRPGSLPAVGYALLTGVLIAVYTVWDKQAVSGLRVPPLVYQWAIEAGLLLLLSPWMLPRRPQLLATWRRYRREAVAVAILSPLAYVLVLTALSIAPVYLVAGRELGPLIGTIMGIRLLAEEGARRRLPAAAAMVVGIGLLAAG
jgi:drug/metabolite transporter (DMT)-like permease